MENEVREALEQIAKYTPTWDGERYSVDGYVVQIAREALSQPQPEARAHCPECQNPPTGCAGVCPEPATEPETDGDARKLAERILQIADDLQDKWDGGDHADMFDKVTERYIDKIAALIQSHDAALGQSAGEET